MKFAAFQALVRQARSCRRFVEADPIPADLVRSLVDLARIVPSAANQQPLRYCVVTAPVECERIFPRLRWAAALKDWEGPEVGERPTAYILIVKPRGANVGYDVGIAAQTIQLAATATGYAACMLGAIDRNALHLDCGLKAEQEVDLVLALGRPGETIVLEEMDPAASPAYWRTPDQVHHVPKRRLGDILLP
ncbi:MAG: nitroreductase family protein [Opitutae bacterium]|nr:nitroreductase family protein [Opitutae bacterium]